MLYIITGEDIVTSRNKVNELIGKKKNVVKLDAKKSSLSELELNFITDNLFSDDKVIVIENFLKIKSQESLIKMINNNQQVEVILWDEGELSPKLKSIYKSARLMSFVFPKYYYSLLDSFTPGNKKIINLLKESLNNLTVEQVFFGLIKRSRQLLILKGNNYQEFSEFSRMQEWQLGKIKTQSDKWDKKDLENLLIELSSLDEKNKTGMLSMDLSRHLDILLIGDLN